MSLHKITACTLDGVRPVRGMPHCSDSHVNLGAFCCGNLSAGALMHYICKHAVVSHGACGTCVREFSVLWNIITFQTHFVCCFVFELTKPQLSSRTLEAYM